MQDTIKSTAIRHPAWVYTVTATAIAFGALSPTPSFVPLISLLTCIRLSAWTFLPRPSGYIFGVVQALCIALASAAVHLAPSMDALSTPNVSLVVLTAITFFTSCFAFAVVFTGCYAIRFTHLTWSQLTLFPALWASAWGFMSSVSPVGQLVTWSPVVGLGPYTWLRSVLGQWGIDWVTAAWAVVFSELIGSWLLGSPDEVEDSLVDQQPLLIDHDPTPTYQSVESSVRKNDQSAESLSPKAQCLLVLATILMLLAVPSYTYSSLPLPINSPDTTPLAVACIMPTPRRGASLTLDDYIQESRRFQSLATTSILLWPESAISFSSPTEKEDAFTKIQDKMDLHKYVGVSFEEVVPSLDGSVARRNGFALVTKGDGPPVMTYYKRNLVPIAESFSMVRGNETPAVITLDLTAPSGRKPSEWAPALNHTRPVPISASICLDFALSSSFTSLESRPALILAPAKTWHVAVGYAMWEQAKARAAETGSTVFWCDGGSGGLGGIATEDYSEIVQRGWGSWSKMVPITYPFDTRRTVYLVSGQLSAFAVVWAMVGVGYGGTLGGRAVQRSLELVRRVTRRE